MIIHETLEQLGLSTRQVDVYLAMLKLGPASVRAIGAEAGVNRGTTWETCKALHELGLVSYFPRGKRRLFCAEPPDRLKALADTRLRDLHEASDRLRTDILPDLAAMTPDDKAAGVRHYEGDAGIEFVLRDILQTVGEGADSFYRVYSSRQIRKYLYRPFPTFTRQRVEQGIAVRVIAMGPGGEDAPLAERKWIPTDEANPAASYVAIYPPRCAMISVIKRDYPTAVILDAPPIALALSLAFDTLWDRL